MAIFPGRRKAALEIGEDVVDMLEADGQPHIAVGDAGRVLLLRRELRMRGGRRMDGQAARVADIGDVIEQLQRIDEAAAGFLAARQLEADEPAIAALEIFIGALADARRSAPTDG